MSWLVATGTSLLLAVSLSAAGPPAAVSPGEVDALGLVSGPVPTFSWGLVEGARAYELVVFDDGPTGHAEPALVATLPGTASSWTPPADGSLLPGRHYAWAIRAVADSVDGSAVAGEWSEPRLFRIRGAWSAAEARALVEALAAAGGDAGIAAPGEAGVSPSPRTGRPPGAPQAAAPAAPRRLAEPLFAAAAAGLRAEGGTGVGLLGITHSPAGAGVVGANLANGPDIVLSGQPGDPLDGTIVRSESAAPFIVESQSGLQVRLDGGALELVDSGASLLYVDAAGNVDAAAFYGDGQHLANVTAADLECVNCVTGAHVQDGSITGTDVVDSSVGGVDFAPSSFTSAHITDGSLTGSDLATDTLTAADLATDSVGAAEIAFAQVSAAKIQTGAVRTAELAAGSVRGPDLVGFSNPTDWHFPFELTRTYVECDGECSDSTLGQACSGRLGNLATNYTYLAVNYRPVLVDCGQIRNLLPLVEPLACGGDNDCEIKLISRTTGLGELCDDTLDVDDAVVSCLRD